MNSDKKHISIIVLCCVFLVPINGLVHAQDWLILKSDNMIGDRLISQTNTIWPISDDSLKTNIIQQRWRIQEKEDFYIDYCEFDSEENAFTGTAYAANSNALPFISGSPTGEIIGDASWVAIDGSAVYFQKGNIGIKIFKPLNPNPEDQNNLMSISNKVLINIREHDPLYLEID
jgi:hypothetical protein